MGLLLRYYENENGATAIEGALTFPFLFFIGFGLARTTNPQSLEDNAKQLAISGNFQSGSKPFIKNLEPSAVSIAYRNIANPETDGIRDYRGGDIVKVVEVKASITYNGIGLLKTITGGSLTLSAQHETRLIG